MSDISTIAAIQMVSSNDLEANLSSASRLMKMASDQGAKLLLLPENFALMADGKKLMALAEDSFLAEGKIRSFLSQHARELKVWIIAGSIPWKSPDIEKPLSRCWVYNALGEVVDYYDKIHLFDAQVGDEQGSYKESDSFCSGDRVVLVNTPFGKVGLSICFDLRFPDLFRALREQGAEIIMVPAAFTWKTGKAHWEILLRARAIESQVYVVAANQAGLHWNNRRTWGHSMIIDPWGETKAVQAEAEGIIVSGVDHDYLKQVRLDIPLQEQAIYQGA